MIELKYKPARDLPKFALEHKTTSPSKLAKIVLQERNTEVTPESITMWFKRHPTELIKISALITEQQLGKRTVDTSIFENGNFRKLASVKNWIIELDARELAAEYVANKLGNLKQVCLGQAFDTDFVELDKWTMRHPDLLTFKHALEWISLIKSIGKDSYRFKRDLKDFLQSKGITVGKKIAVGKPRGYGKYARLYVERDTIDKMLSWLMTQDYEAYVLDRFMFETATRISASLKARIEKFAMAGDRAVINLYDKGRRSKNAKGKEHDKVLQASLAHEIKRLIGKRKSGYIFSISRERITELNHQAIERFAPEIIEQFPKFKEVNHFWRHQFYQHILRLCAWNYSIAAALGGSTPQSVEESYGKPPEETVKAWQEKYHL